MEGEAERRRERGEGGGIGESGPFGEKWGQRRCATMSTEIRSRRGEFFAGAHNGETEAERGGT